MPPHRLLQMYWMAPKCTMILAYANAVLAIGTVTPYPNWLSDILRTSVPGWSIEAAR